MMDHTRRIMTKLLPSIKIIVQRLDFVRKWKQWLEPLGISGFSGCAGKGSPHFFRFSMRKLVPAAAFHKVDHPGHADDVFFAAVMVGLQWLD